MLNDTDSPAEVAPLYSGASLVVASRGLENLNGRNLVIDRAGGFDRQKRPLLGEVWDCEYYVDTGSRSVRSTKGVEEGFLLKASVLERCYCGKGPLNERILYPFSRGSPPYLVITGSERQRQASVYVAELALILSLALNGGKCGGKPLVVKHGSILQRLDVYFNPVFDMEPKTARTVLSYFTLDKSIVVDIVDWATISRDGREVANPGLIAAALLGEIKKAVGRGASVIGLSEDTSAGRHLIAEALASLVEAHSAGNRLRDIVEEGINELKSHDCLDCLSDVSGSYWAASSTRTGKIARDVEDYIEDLVVKASGTPVQGSGSLRSWFIKKIYEAQLLNNIGLANDSAFLMLYMYLYGHTIRGRYYPATPLHSKSELYRPLIEKSFHERIEAQKIPISLDSIIERIEGVSYIYVFPEKPPSCLDLMTKEEKLGVDRRLLAEIVRVKPPVKVEVLEREKRKREALTHITTQATTTYYGVPPQLLVVDSRSRVSEWEMTALRSLVEELSRRVVPYSTFLRDFQTRRLYMR
ncbi:MAG: hypothetical protein F7C07_00815 [Desulfurococcales archaeon]|nr:hypothetical protein [Desulfurococcales archaeon]